MAFECVTPQEPLREINIQDHKDKGISRVKGGRAERSKGAKGVMGLNKSINKG